MTRQPRKPSDGMALVSVLWLLLLLSGLAATVTSIARINALLTHRELDVARGEAAADAAISESIGLLSDAEAVRHPALHDNERTTQIDSIPVIVRVSNEAGRIDINSASDEWVLAFLQGQGVDEEHAANLLDDLRRFQSREGPANTLSTDRLLQAVDELRALESWRAAGLECWLDSLTVYSQQAEVNPSAATPQVLAAVQWLKAHRGLDPLTARTQSADEPSNVGGVFRIRASAKVSSDVVIEREWVGRVTGDIHHPALTMLWDAEHDNRGHCSH